MEIVVVGAGHVGLVAACCLANSGHRVTGVEIDKAKLELLNSGISPFYERGIEELLHSGLSSQRLAFSPTLTAPVKAEVVMIAVNTPSLADGSTDLSQVYAAVTEVRDKVRDPVIMVMKSTVPPGTGNTLVKSYLEQTPVTYVANPEFLRSGQAIDDWYHPSRIVIGTNGRQALDEIGPLYANISAPLLVTDVTSAEMIKIAANAFLTVRISFINEIANLCEILGARIDDVVKGLGLDPRFGTDFLRPGVGYGGPCLPKDARSLNYLAAKNGYDFKLLRATIEVNTRQRILIIQKLKQLLGPLNGKEIALLGLAFKPYTDDVTDAPSLDIARLLIAEGAKLRVHGFMAMINARPLLPESVVFAEDIYSATAGANAAVLITEWPEFIEADWEAIKERMLEPYVILDGRNALPRKKMLAAGFRYVGIGG